MSVESSVSANGESADSEVTKQELLQMFKEQQTTIEHLERSRQQQQERIDDLEAELEAERERREELEKTVKTFKNLTGPAFAQLVNGINETESDENDHVDDMETVGWGEPEIVPEAIQAAERVQERGSRLDSVEDDVRRHESEIQDSHSLSADSQAEHWSRVVKKAQNVHGMSQHTLPDGWVILYKEDIAGAIEPGPKRSSQLIDEWTDTSDPKHKQGAECQPYRPPANSRNNEAQKKGIKIDLDVWGDDDV